MQTNDYLKFFGFQQHPFTLTPDPAFFYPSMKHRGVMESLLYGIRRGDGFLVLAGPAGTGKSLVIRMVVQELQEEADCAVLLTPMVDPVGLMAMIMEELTGQDFSEQASTLPVLLKQFKKVVMERAAQGRSVLLVIDEAQNLSAGSLEQLRMLSNFELGSRKLVQVLLSGQEGLKGLLTRKGLGQLCQRITVSEQLCPFNRKETALYARFRMARAGADVPMSRQAKRMLFRKTRGIPRLVNRLMDRALLMAAAKGRRELDGSSLKMAERSMGIVAWQQENQNFTRSVLNRFFRWLLPTAAGIGFILSGTSFITFDNGERWHTDSQEQGIAVGMASETVDMEQQSERVVVAGRYRTTSDTGPFMERDFCMKLSDGLGR